MVTKQSKGVNQEIIITSVTDHQKEMYIKLGFGTVEYFFSCNAESINKMLSSCLSFSLCKAIMQSDLKVLAQNGRQRLTEKYY